MDTVIHFVGLFVFMTMTIGGNATGRAALQTTNPNVSQSVIIAIAPSVTGDPRLQRPMSIASGKNREEQEPRSRAVLTAADHNSSFVEAHTTMITFHLRDNPSVTGWTATRLKASEDWYYVVLSGEQITFAADAPNVNVDTKSLSRLPLRHLGHTLLSAYSASGGYKKVAGVFTITKGTLSACSYNKSTEGAPGGRIDTKLTLNTDGQLTIIGPGNKRITLNGGAEVFIGNIPMAFAKSGALSPNAHEHYKVYCEMVGDTTCVWPPAGLESRQLIGVGDCGDGLAFRQRAGNTESTLPPFVVPGNEMNDFACSNTQWP